MLRVGLTGGIGCGKSTVAEMFAALDIPVIDTDVIAHQLTGTGGVALPAIEATFGAEALLADGTLDRAVMRHRIFTDAIAREKLQAILHTLILQAVQQRLHTISNAPYVLVVVPLLIEAKSYQQLIDRILVVDCTEAQQIDRVVLRTGMSAGEINAIIATQCSRSTRLANAEDVILNTGNVSELHEQIGRLHEKYLGLAGKAL